VRNIIGFRLICFRTLDAIFRSLWLIFGFDQSRLRFLRCGLNHWRVNSRVLLQLRNKARLSEQSTDPLLLGSGEDTSMATSHFDEVALRKHFEVFSVVRHLRNSFLNSEEVFEAISLEDEERLKLLVESV
jgi:hypothetical protein